MRRLPLVLALAFAGLPAAAQTASFQGLGNLPGRGDRNLAVSADGNVVVGQSGSASGTEAFRWTAGGGLVGLGDFPVGDFFSMARDVSAGGVVVGVGSGADGRQAFRWTANGGMVNLGNLPSYTFGSRASGVSADGNVVVGWGFGAAQRTAAFRWTAGSGLVNLGDLPSGVASAAALAVSADGTVVVGTSSGADGWQPFRWTAGGGMVNLGSLPPYTFQTYATDVSADGNVVVGWGEGRSGIRTEGFRWTASSGMVGLGSLPGLSIYDQYSQALSVSCDGAVIVGKGRDGAGNAAFRWTAETGMQSVRALLVAAGVDLTGWQLPQAQSTSADGTVIVGEGVNPQGRNEAWRAVLPLTTVGCEDPSPETGPDVALAVSPNPVRDRATVRFRLPAARPARLVLLDVLGRTVAVVTEGGRGAGEHTVRIDTSRLPAGVYAARLDAGGEVRTQRFTVVR